MQQALATGGLTQVELLRVEKRVETWIRFGQIAREQIIDVTRRIVSFAPNSVFAVVYWAANDNGTILSQIDILRAVTPGEPYVAVPDIQPGADISNSARLMSRARPIARSASIRSSCTRWSGISQAANHGPSPCRANAARVYIANCATRCAKPTPRTRTAQFASALPCS